MLNLTPSQLWILNDAFEERYEAIHVSPKSTNSDHDRLVELGLLRPVMTKSGLHPEYGYRLTLAGYKAVYEAKDNAQT